MNTMMTKNTLPLWSSLEASVVTGGRSSCDWNATGVSLNVEEVRPGDLFLAGPHDDIEKAYAQGAAVVAVPRGFEVCDDRPVLHVGSAFTALQGLSAAARFRTHATVIAVQGVRARDHMTQLLSVSHDVHSGGKHVSLGLANLPAHADFGVFGLSPAVKPDVAVITNPDTAHRDTLFETMGRHSAVIIYADAPGFLEVVSRAKAAGIGTILTYGRHACADSAIDQCVMADNGIRLSGEVMGQSYSVVVPTAYQDNEMILAAFLVMALTGRSLDVLLPQGDENRVSHAGVALMDKALGEKNGLHAVFRIRHMIDLGRGRQTAVLDNLNARTYDREAQSFGRVKLPVRCSGLDLVHTGKNVQAVRNPYAPIKQRYKKRGVEHIAPTVLSPGDFLVFREIWNSSRVMLSQALRLSQAA